MVRGMSPTKALAYPSTGGDAKKVALWARNPEYYVRECIQEGLYSFIWDEPYLFKHSLDPIAFATMWCGGLPWRSIVVNDEDDEALETRHDGVLTKHDVWTYGDDEFDKLEDTLERNAGTDRMVIVMRIPNLNEAISKKFLKLLDEINKEYPTSTIHLHGLYSWRWMFGLDWGSVDIEPRSAAKTGRLHVPNGMRQKYDRMVKYPEWVKVVGMQVRDLQKPRNRCIYNIRSAEWASKYYKETPLFATKYTPAEPEAKPKGNRRVFFRYIEPEDGDRLACDTCSLAVSCRFYREGAICAVPGSDVANLSDYFNTRDADAIVEGLGDLLGTQLMRLQAGMDAEEESLEKSGELSPAVTTLFDRIFKDGVTLAKLIDPMLAKPSLQINLNGAGATPVEPANKQSLVAAVVGELEARGVARADITEEMVNNLLSERAEQAAITRG